MTRNTYGTLEIVDHQWRLRADPHVMMMAKRIFQKIDKSSLETIHLSDTTANARDLQWFCSRYPMEMDAYSIGHMKFHAQRHVDHVLKMDQIIAGKYEPKLFQMALPPREYQAIAATLYLNQKFLLLGDDVGLGKTIVSIASFCDPRTLPAFVVCYPFLQHQWMNQIFRFLPGTRVHIIKSEANYPLPPADVFIITYSKLMHWAGVISKKAKSVTFDEVQELRRNEGSKKYEAAKMICDRVEYRLGLSATPIFNYGGEIFNVLDCLKKGCLGEYEEFKREWCESREGFNGSTKLIVKDPVALGNFLRNEFVMLRRTREEVGKELPEIQQIVETIDADPAVLQQVKTKAIELARLILSRTNAPEDRMNAAGRLDNLIRQQTGIAKAPFVAQFVRMLIESGERVLLAGWHHAVYEIWKEFFHKQGVKYAMFTGEETPKEKEAARTKFINGDIEVLIMSLRSGAGIDGLQGICRTVVLGEFDWSPAVHHQFIGRVHREGQHDLVNAYFLAAETGADPLMLEVLGLKGSQIAGINDGKGQMIVGRRNTDHIKRLAMQYLEAHK